MLEAWIRVAVRVLLLPEPEGVILDEVMQRRRTFTNEDGVMFALPNSR